MQNTYEKILKYLIAHDVELTIRPVQTYTVIQVRHKNRYATTKLNSADLSNDFNIMNRWIAEKLRILFPSFKDFDTPIKVSK